MSGFVVLHRKILQWEWFSDPKMVQFFMYCILRANYQDTKYKGIEVKRGEFICSIPTIQADLNLSVQEIRTCIKRLKSTGEITDKTTNKYRIISLCNYSVYQDLKNENNRQDNRQNNSPVTDKQQTNNSPVTADNNITNKQSNNLTKESNPPTPLKGSGVGVCLKEFYQSNNQQDFREICFLIAKARKHTDDDASKHFEQFENYWLNPALPASKASKKDWQRAFINWIAKTKPSKTSNVKVAEEILEKAKERLAHLLDENSTQLDSSLVFLRALKSGTTKEDIYKILVGIMNNPPPTKIYSWAIINQYA